VIWLSESDPNVALADAAVVLVHESLTSDRVVAVYRRERPTQRCLPGGSVDAGETPRRAARRELKEEVGLDVPEHSLTFLGAVEIVVGGGLPPIVALYEAPRGCGYAPEPTELEPELRPHWARLIDLCDVEVNGDFAESARFAADMLRARRP
jgi:8-oxo-dGTP pyrophosphatase MutT (NUDIX family)